MSYISLDDENGQFVLRQLDDDGAEIAKIVITSDDVLRLGHNAQSLSGRILAQQSRPGMNAVVMTPVAQVELNTDLHKSAIHLTMFDQYGTGIGFSLVPEVARPLADRLPVRVAEIEAALKKATRQ